MPVTLRTDQQAQKREPGTYLSLHGALYYVESYEPTGMCSGKLWVTCIRKGSQEHETWLKVAEVERAEIVRPAPTLEVPDTLEQELAA